MFTIREAKPEDAESIKDLYFNHLTTNPPTEEQDMGQWREKIASFEKNELYYLLVCEADTKVVASVTFIVLENLNHNLRPFSMLQNVVTHSDYRGRHYATALIDHAREIAKKLNCDRMMLMTGSKLESTLKFYENCGFNSHEKTGFLHRL